MFVSLVLENFKIFIYVSDILLKVLEVVFKNIECFNLKECVFLKKMRFWDCMLMI